MVSAARSLFAASDWKAQVVWKPAPLPPAPAAYTEGSQASWLDRIEREEQEGQSWWENRLEVGTRITLYTLTDTERHGDESFLGSINRLKEDDDYLPVKLYANFWLREWAGVGLSYEKISAVTWTAKEGVDGYSDGTFSVHGPILSALLAWPNQTRFTPFAELGQMLMFSSVKTDPEWANAHGIPNYQDFVITDEKGGFLWGVGCAFQLNRELELDAIFRQINASVIVDHTLGGHVRHGDKEFPLDSDWFGVGLKYRF
jgi:opacity protein-like surface antigen